MIAGVGGAALLLFLFLPWFDGGGDALNGWEGQSSTDIYLLITAAVAIATAATAGEAISLPGTTMNGSTALLGVVATVLILWLLLFDFPEGADRGIGIILSLFAAGAIAYGGYTAAEGE